MPMRALATPMYLLIASGVGPVQTVLAQVPVPAVPQISNGTSVAVSLGTIIAACVAGWKVWDSNKKESQARKEREEKAAKEQAERDKNIAEHLAARNATTDALMKELKEAVGRIEASEARCQIARQATETDLYTKITIQGRDLSNLTGRVDEHHRLAHDHGK